MKKSVIALALVGIMPMLAANAAPARSNSSASLNRNTYKATSHKTGGYKNTITNNFYYNAQPATAKAPKQYTKTKTTDYSYTVKSEDERPVYSKNKTVKKTRKTSSQERKYFLAHPFFQPLQGRFGSVTDISYAKSNFDVTLLNGASYNIDATSTGYDPSSMANNIIVSDPALNLKGEGHISQFAVKEDVSFGLSDTLALMLMAQYDKTEIEVGEWNNGEPGTKNSTSGVNVFGVGLQARVADTSDYIAMLSAYFQHQKDSANTIMGEIKVGTKVDRYTLYGFARASYSMLENEGAYGAYIKEDTGDWLMLSYKTDTDSVFQVEGGAGVFGVFTKYITGKAELTYGSYDWHNQLAIRGEIGYQPGDSFALNLYASASLYDSANGKVKEYMNYDLNPDTTGWDASTDPNVVKAADTKVVYTTGEYKIEKYNEWKVGIQGILYF